MYVRTTTWASPAFLGTASQGVRARRAWTSRCRRAEQSCTSAPSEAQSPGGHGMQIRVSAFKGESVSVTDLLADSLALTGLATLDGLTAQGNVGCDQLLCNDINCTDVFTTGVDALRNLPRCAYHHSCISRNYGQRIDQSTGRLTGRCSRSKLRSHRAPR